MKKDVEIRVRLQGRNISFRMGESDNNILEAAQNAGIDLPSSCRAGSCSTCRAKIIQGEVSMAINMGLDDDDIAAGFILSCQAKPLTPCVVLDFDVI